MSDAPIPYTEEDDVSSLGTFEEPKKISSKEEAVRYAYGLSQTRKEIEELTAIAEAEKEKWLKKIEEVEEWYKSVIEPLKRKENYLETMLSLWHQEQYYNASEKQKKNLMSIKLPYGITLKSRAQQPVFEITDEEAYRKYAEEHGLLKDPTPPEPKWNEAKKRLVVKEDGTIIDSETGEVITWVRAVPQDRKFEVT